MYEKHFLVIIMRRNQVYMARLIDTNTLLCFAESPGGNTALEALKNMLQFLSDVFGLLSEPTANSMHQPHFFVSVDGEGVYEASGVNTC